MLRNMLDTNVCIHLLRGRGGPVRARFAEQAAVSCISAVTYHELVHGAARAADPHYERTRVDELATGLEVLDFDAEAASHSGEIHAALARAGQLIGAYDMLIAGHARSLGLKVITANLREFARVEGLLCEDWTG
jgi:tRNA(fMet)-specific endonuclease VapC